MTEQSFMLNVRGAERPPPPTLRITGPTENAVVNRSVNVYGAFTVAPGAPNVTQVDVRVDVGPWTPASIGAEGTWTLVLDTSKYPNKSHRLTARAFDGKAYSDEAIVNITVDNPQYILMNYNTTKDADFRLPLGALAALMIAVPLLLFLYIRGKYARGPALTQRGGRKVVYRPVPPMVAPEDRSPPLQEPPAPAAYRAPPAAPPTPAPVAYQPPERPAAPAYKPPAPARPQMGSITNFAGMPVASVTGGMGRAKFGTTPPASRIRPQPNLGEEDRRSSGSAGGGVTCPKCRKSFRIQRTAGPQRIRCPHCGAAGTVGGKK